MPGVAATVAPAAAAVGVSLIPGLGPVAGAVLGGVAAYGAARLVGAVSDDTAELLESGVSTNSVSNVAPVPIVYGRRRVGGAQILRDTGGSKNKYLYVAQILSEGPIGGVEQVLMDGEDAISRFGMTQTGSNQWSGEYVRMTIYTGEPGQVANEMLVNAVNSWTSAFIGRNLAYIAFRFQYKANKFPTGVPLIEAIINGRICYDPRDGTYSATQNPVLQLRDYATSTAYGRSIDAADLDDASIREEADYCDEIITWPDGTQAPRYRSNAYLSPDEDMRANMLKLATSCRALVIQSGGYWRFLVDKPTLPTTFEFNEDNITGNWSIELGSKANRFNKLRLRMAADEAREWQPNLATLQSAQFLADDNGQLHETQLETPCSTTLTRAEAIGIQELKQSRQSMRVSFTATPEALKVQAGDVVPITHSTPGWTAKPFRITRMEVQSSHEVRIDALEYDPSVYDLTSLETEPAIPDTDLPDPFNLAPPQNLAVTSGTEDLLIAGDGTIQTRIHATWDPPDDGFAVRYEVRWRQSLVTGWNWMQTADTDVYLQPVKDQSIYDIEVRSISILGNESAWVLAHGHYVEGKTEAPPDVWSFSVSELPSGTRLYEWEADDEVPDLLGYQIRWAAQGTTDWDTMIRLHEGVITSSPYYAQAPYAGTWTFAIKAIDRSGNLSDNARFADATLTQSVNNFAWQAQPAVEGWPGTLTDCVGSQFSLRAINDGQWSDLTTWAAWNAWATNTRSPIVYQYPDIDLGAAASVDPVVTGVFNGVPTNEWSHSTDGVAWSAWESVEAAAPINRRYHRFRITITGANAQVRQLRLGLVNK